VSFHKEGIESIDISLGQTDVGFIEGHSGLFGRVDTSQVNDQCVVDEDPKIVITIEAEHFVTSVSEVSVKFE